MRLFPVAWCGFLLAVAVAAFALPPPPDEEEVEEFLIEWKGTLVLDPRLEGLRVYRWEWRRWTPELHDGNDVVRWNARSCWRECQNANDCWADNFLSRYGHLDIKEGTLTIENVRVRDSGHYSVTYYLHRTCRSYATRKKEFRVTVLKSVPAPAVSVVPEECDPGEDGESSCDLICNGNIRGAGRVAYTWKQTTQFDEPAPVTNETEGWNSPMLVVRKDSHQHVKEFSCQMVNRLGNKSSVPFPNPFYKKFKILTKRIPWYVGPVATSLSFTIVPTVGCMFRWLFLH